jgi:signal transduction histidine kinase
MLNAADEAVEAESTAANPEQTLNTNIIVPRRELTKHELPQGDRPKQPKSVAGTAEINGAAGVNIPTPKFISQGDENIRIRRKEAVALVRRGIQVATRNLDEAFNRFTHGKDSRGEMYLFCYDEKGNCYAHGEDKTLVWQNMYTYQDAYGTPMVQMMIEVAKQGGGWVTYEWRNTTKVAYVEGFNKNNKFFIIGTGYYPHSKADATVNLVKGAVAHFNEVIKDEYSIAEVFSDFSYPLGAYLKGDLYLYALDFNGRIMAQGDRPQLIGQNALNYVGANGKQVNKIIIDKLKEGAPAVWVDYISKNATKWAYAEKVTDLQGNNYFIAAGFYPDANREATINLVRRGAQYLAKQGVSRAAKEISDKRSSDFLYGDLSLFIYDFKGNVIANGNNPELIGTNQWDDKDGDGKYFVRDFIKTASEKDEKGWVDYKVNNLFQAVYVERVKIGLEEYVVGSGLYPFSKKEEAILLVKSAVSELRDNPDVQVFRDFANKKGSFIRGDLHIFVYDTRGLCFVDGDNFGNIWRNHIGLKDDEGKPFVKMYIDAAKRGAEEVTYRYGGLVKNAYVERLEKEGMTYILGVSYYK